MTESISYEELVEKIEAVLLKSGVSQAQAGPVARVIASGERDGCKSHGVYRIAGVLRTSKAGKVNRAALPQVEAREDDAIVRVNARGGFSSAAFELGLPILAGSAKRLGMSGLVINECVHFTALWPEVEALAAEGFAALAMCPSYASVAPFGGKHPLLGTNPIAFAWPRRDAEPFVFDFATSIVARGEIELHHRAGKELPVGWAVDKNGAPTVDPAAALAGAMLPFGGHKGSAIGVMIELLAGAMIGDLISTEALAHLGSTALLPMHGELVLAFSPERFSSGRNGDPFEKAESLFSSIIEQGARLPSQRRFAARANAAVDGISLSSEEWAELNRFFALGLDAVSL